MPRARPVAPVTDATALLLRSAAMAASSASAAPPASSSSPADRALDAGLVVLAAAWLARLVPQALAARLQTDECFHAAVSRWIAAHGTLPRTIDGLYGGFAYFYPPLYHLLGATAFRVAGLDGFLLLNVAVVAATLVAVAHGARALAGRAAARWAVALCLATGFFATHAVRMYVEALSTLLVVVAALALARVLRAARARDAVVLGVAAGLSIVAKLSALVLPPVLAALALGAVVRRRAALARALAAAVAIAVGVASPLFARNARLFGSAIYPALGRDVHPLLMKLNVAHFTPPPAALYLDVLRRTGPVTGACLLVALVLSVRLRRSGIEWAMIAAAVALALAAPAQGLVEVRHLLPLIVTVAALAAVALARALAGRARAARAADALALAVAAWAVLAMPHWRAREDLDEAPPMLEAFAAVHAHVPPGETVLARETYDTFWYAQRPANWPVPFGQPRPPIEMLLTADPDSAEASLRAHGIRWVLLSDEPRPGPFDGADWPEGFVRALERLGERGRAREVWSSDDARLWRLGP